MIRTGAISSVVVAGGGIVGWSAAAALKRQLPMLDVTIVAIEPPPDALADRLSGTLPSIAGFHDDLGLTDTDTVAGAKSSPRLGTRFEGWAARDYTTLTARSAKRSAHRRSTRCGCATRRPSRSTVIRSLRPRRRARVTARARFI